MATKAAEQAKAKALADAEQANVEADQDEKAREVVVPHHVGSDFITVGKFPGLVICVCTMSDEGLRVGYCESGDQEEAEQDALYEYQWPGDEEEGGDNVD